MCALSLSQIAFDVIFAGETEETIRRRHTVSTRSCEKFALLETQKSQANTHTDNRSKIARHLRRPSRSCDLA